MSVQSDVSTIMRRDSERFWFCQPHDLGLDSLVVQLDELHPSRSFLGANYCHIWPFVVLSNEQLVRRCERRWYATE